MMYAIHLIKENGDGSYLSVKGRTEWKTRKIAERHAKDIQTIIDKRGNFMGNIIVDVESV